MTMLGSARLAAFAATADPDAARLFYRDTLGLTLVSEDDFAIVFEANGTTLRIQKVREVVVAPYTALGWRVDDIFATAAALRARGVEFLRYSFMQQDELGIWSAPGGAKVAWFNDPAGHVLSVAEQDDSE